MDQAVHTTTIRRTWIDSLKGIAILGVIMIHSGGGSLPSFLGLLGRNGAWGVQLFFMITAYLAFCSLDRYYAGSKERISYRTARNWFISKFLRIAPLYYLAIPLYLLLEGTGSRFWLGSQPVITGWNILSHYLFVNGFDPYFINSILGVEWYLADLALFFILAPALYKYIDNVEKAIILLITSTIAISIINSIAMAYPLITDMNIWSYYVGNFWFPNQFPVMAAGICLYFILPNISEKFHGHMYLGYTLLLGSIFFILSLLAGGSLPNISGFVLFAIGYGGMAISQEIYQCPLVDNKLFSLLGKNSYGIYLIHFLLVYEYDHLNLFPQPNSITAWLIKFMVIVLASLAISIVVKKWVEDPIALLGQRWLSSHENLSSSAG